MSFEHGREAETFWGRERDGQLTLSKEGGWGSFRVTVVGGHALRTARQHRLKRLRKWKIIGYVANDQFLVARPINIGVKWDDCERITMCSQVKPGRY